MFPQIEAAIRQALISRASDDLAVLKLLKSDILAAAKVQLLETPTDEICRRVVQRHLKQYREAAELYDRLGQPTQAADKRSELAVVEALLPPQLSPDKLMAVVEGELAEIQDLESVRLGDLIQQVQARVGEQSSAGEIAQTIRRYLKLQQPG